jgi:lysosomal acid lipase/cholesteryl ester hydrolase
VSLKTIAHYAQILTTGRFTKFDYGDEKANQEVYGLGVTSPPEYDLSRVTAPSVFFWSENDIIAVPQVHVDVIL